MKKFRFKLEKLLRLREIEEDEKKNALAKVMAKRNLEEEGIKKCHERIRANAKELASLSVEESMMLRTNVDSFTIALNNEIKKHNENIESMQSEIEEKRSALAEAIKNRKIVEKLKERKLTEYKKQQKKEEQKIADEIRRKESIFGDLKEHDINALKKEPTEETVVKRDDHRRASRGELIDMLKKSLGGINA